MEHISLLMDRTMDATIFFHEKNELNLLSISSFYGNLFEKYIDDLFHNREYITIDEKKIYRNDEDMIIQYIMDGKIIIRDKDFVHILNILKTLKYNEDQRMIFIEKVKNIKIDQIFEKIDQEYVKHYEKSPQKYDISLSNLSIPNINVYNYAMTFERRNCKLSVEKDEIYLYYRYNQVEYKIILKVNREDEKLINSYIVCVDLDKRKLLLPLANSYRSMEFFVDECFCVNQIMGPFVYMYNYVMKENKNPKKIITHIERRYMEHICKYHRVDLFGELSKKYKNYEFDICYNYRNGTIENDKYSYLSLVMM